ncbi:unnamed protein product [Cylindrotheca closterium]|uniref:PPIase cyclophilin-type domain-containing protein n=1 Tax=Cylindrotheca closterium TaxID=2856 RepID=A0AAD2FJ55_9STRA|nr:unnamed protein product [Cylindrotheca closterium]
MPRKSLAKRRREPKVDDEEDENPKDGKTQKVQTTPTQATGEAISNPPPIQLHSNPKVSSSAVKGIPPPPIEEEEGGNNNGSDDMIPPAMTVNLKTSSSKKATASKSKAESSAKKESSSSLVEEVEEEEEALEEMEDASSHGGGGGATFNLLLVLLLLGLGCSAGFVHQRIVQDLQLQLKGYQQDLRHSESSIATLAEERNGAVEQADKIRSELIDLAHEIRYFARQQLKAKFGPGPIYPVELELEFPGADGEINLQYMTIELDGDNMPHAVLTFMSQVDSGLYQKRGFGFHHAGDHIIFGSPMGVDGNGYEFGRVWEDSGFSRLLFHEHSEMVPHVPYTIGFNGRGPNLYFNMVDNTEPHRDSRDPCFGTISRGRNVVDYMHTMAGALNPGDWKELENAVIIRSATILRSA